ncbi:MAG TPA: hypothetical protein VFC78_10535 [Tepidisphaeraceae bacterium]|nr:hypothetical protein [Tepidisphaeraceae bacterium]
MNVSNMRDAGKWFEVLQTGFVNRSGSDAITFNVYGPPAYGRKNDE